MMSKTAFLLIFLLSCNLAAAGDLQVRFNEDDGATIPDAVVEIITPSVPVPEDWDFNGIMDQVDKEFIDNVVITVAGSYITFPNSDDIQHHVYSFSDNKSFELPLYSGNEAEPILFDVPGVAVVGCNIHDWMLGYIYVSKSHLVTKSNEHGIAVFEDFAAGDYQLQIWHERARRSDQFSTFDVSIPATGVATIDIELNLGRDRRIRRAPSSSNKTYN